MASREAELFKDKIEITLDGRQVFYLFFGGSVIACLVFIHGVMVGRRVEARSTPAAASAVSDPLAALDALETESGELAFPSALRGEASGGLAALDRRLAAKPVTDGGAPADRGAPVAAPGPERPASSDEREPIAAIAAEAADEKAAKKVDAKVDKKKVDEKKADEKADQSDDEPSEERDDKPARDRKSGSYTLQLSSFQDRGEANEFLAEMKAAGYEAYLAEAEVEGKGTWFRIRVGSYSGFDEAVRAKADFESKQKIIAYVTRLK